MSRIDPTAAEVAAVLPGDDVVPDAEVVMDRAMTLPAAPAEVWPWLAQLGKRRGGWYMSRRVERFVPPSRRALRSLREEWLHPAVGDVVPDWGGRNADFVAVVVAPGRCLVQRSTRGDMRLTWTLLLTPVAGGQTRLHLRLRLAGVKRPRFAEVLGGAVDLATVVLLRAGLDERLRESS
ncbi:hypothetical protein ACXR2U_00125 [Jatrophihabitans sp. YIM 134969]